MSADIRAAAERLRQVKNSVVWQSIYFGLNPAQAREAMLNDAAIVIDACLDEHPEDDDEPVTEEWLRSIGFERGISRGTMFIKLPSCCETTDRSLVCGDIDNITDCPWEVWNYGMPEDDDAYQEGTVIVDQCPTRRAVRQLLAALGIATKEPTA